MKMKNLKQVLLLILNINLFFTTNTKSVDLKPLKGKITGVVTYYFNDNLGYIPDVGTKVYIVLSSDIKNKEIFNDPGALMKFCSILDFRNTWLDYKRTGDTPPSDLIQKIHEYKIDDTAYFNAVDRNYFGQFLEIENAAKIIRVVDASGNFSAEVDTGEYFVLIISSHRTALSMCEIHGKPYFRWVILKPDEEENISPKFSEF